MKWIYIAAGIALFVKMLILPNSAPVIPDFSIVESIVKDGGIPNAVTVIILRKMVVYPMR